MKSFNIIPVVALLMLIFAGCQKSEITPRHCGTTATSQTETTTSDISDQAPVNGRTMNTIGDNESVEPATPTINDIVGGGDDDRDGGDKKAKAQGR